VKNTEYTLYFEPLRSRITHEKYVFSVELRKNVSLIKTPTPLKLAPKNKRNRILAASRAIIRLLPENESSEIIIRDIDSLRN